MTDMASWIAAGTTTAVLALVLFAGICCRSESKKKFPKDAV